MSDRGDHKTKARWGENAERYDDMVEEMKQLVKGLKADESLDEEERSLLSVAYKNVVGSRRSSWRVVNAKYMEDQENEKKKNVCLEMKQRIEKELNGLCKDVLDLIDNHLIKNPENVQAKIFFLKMKGDYYRYMVEICEQGDSRNALAEKAGEAYQEAMDVAKEQLPPTSAIRLGLALNYSVFFYEIKNSPDKACELAKQAFDDAIAKLEEINDESYKDSTLIMQLLRDNLTLWKSEIEEDQQEQQQEDV